MTRVLHGERLCRRCFANVRGAAIERETTYGLDVVRCPQCGDVDAVTSFPLEGPAGVRWRTGLAAFIALQTILKLMAVLGVAVLINFGATMASADSVSWQIGSRYRAWYQARHPATAQNRMWSEDQFELWWSQQGDAMPSVMRSEVEIGEYAINLIAWLGLFFAGAIVAAMMVSRGRWHVLRLWVVVAAVLTLAIGVGWFDRMWRVPASSDEVMWMYVALPYLTFAYVVDVIMLGAGILSGRAVTRWVIRALLPPRRRAPFAELWRAVGREPPLREEVTS